MIFDDGKYMNENDVLKVSVIIPVYNSENYIKQTLDNVLAQTYSNIEVLLVDDASTDNTVQIIEEYKRLNPRIILIEKSENSGQGISKNIALRKAAGDIICFMDSDDLMKEDIIERCMKLMIDYDADIVCFGYSSGDFDSDYRFYVHNEIYTLSGTEAASAMMRREGLDSNTWGKLYRKHLFNGLAYEGGRFENISVTWRILLRANKVCNSGILGYAHLIRPNQVTASYYNEKDWNYISRTQKLVEDVKEDYPELIESAQRMHLEAVRAIFAKVQSGGRIEKEKYIYLSKTFDSNMFDYLKHTLTFRETTAIILLRLRLYGIVIRLMNRIDN